jgi:hypothetical protein
MDDVPPYSPTAAASERRLPNDHHAYLVDDEEDRLIRSSTTIDTTSRDGLSYHSPLIQDHNALRTIITAPPILVPSEPPPEYAPVDALASSFRIDAPLIYATKTSKSPRYQLLQEFTRSGKPRKLSIRRLLPSETRSTPLPALDKTIRYDEDGTMYTITPREMRGHRASTLAGSIQLESGRNVLGGKWTKIWLLTKNARRNSLNPENEARILKYGYHADDEWDKQLLFSIKRGVWVDGEGRSVAVEEDVGRLFEVLEKATGKRRDLLVSCWVMKAWIGEGIRWEGDRTGCATVRIEDASNIKTLLQN